MTGRCGLLALAAVLLVFVGGCRSGTDDAAPGSTPPAPVSLAATPSIEARTVEPTIPPVGHVHVVLGESLDVVLALDRCRIDDQATPSGAEPVRLVTLEASGTTAEGDAVRLELDRFRQVAAATTITDTITVYIGPSDQPTRVLQAQRFEVGGLVTDGRDPGASAPLLRIRSGIVDAAGPFAPPGSFLAAGGVVDGALVAVCRASDS